MPPFRYETFVDPYVGTIAELMGAGQRAEAQAAAQIAEIRAREAQQRGQAWGSTIQGIGDLAATTITEWNSPEARRQRELDKARKIIRTGSDRVRQVEDRRYREGDPRLQMGSIGSTIENLRPTVTTGTMFGDTAPTEAELDAMQAGQIQLPDQISSSSAALPEMTVGARDPGMVQGDPYIETLTRDIKGYLTDDGFFDPRRAIADLSAGGISQSVINEMMSDLSGNNEMLAAWDALETQNEDDQTVLFGRLAATAIKQSENGVLPINHAIALNLEPLEVRFGKEAINDLRVRLIGLPPDQQKSVLMDAVKAADDILGYTVMTPGQGLVGVLGEPRTPLGLSPVAEAQAAVMKATRTGDPGEIAAAVDMLVNVSDPTSSAEEARLEEGLSLERGTLALARVRQAEVERANREGAAIDREGLAISAGESLRRYPASLISLLVTDDQNVINIEESMRALGLPITPKEGKLFSRADWTTTGAFSVIARTIGPLMGISEQSMGNISAIEIGEAIVVRALAENERLAERERTAIADALDMATTIGQAPDTIRVKFREIDAVLRRALYRKDEIDDVKAILQAIDVLGVPQGNASAMDAPPPNAAYTSIDENGKTIYHDVDGKVIP